MVVVAVLPPESVMVVVTVNLPGTKACEPATVRVVPDCVMVPASVALPSPQLMLAE